MALNESKDINVLRKFDIDLSWGQQWEKYIDNIFSGVTTSEVKSERDQWHRTGNIAIELACRGKPSGLQSTKSDMWVHNLIKNNEHILTIMIKTERLKEIIIKMAPQTRIINGGDNNASVICLVPIKALINETIM
jgi:hypothetical protein